MKRRLPPDSVFREAVGQAHGHAWVLLKRITHWERYARVHWDGHVWVARARWEWAEEVGATERQVKRWLGLLRDRGLIETSKHRFGGRCLGHVRLSRRGRRAVWGSNLVGPYRVQGRGHKGSNRVGPQRVQPYTLETVTGDNTGDSHARAGERESAERGEEAGVRGGRTVEQVREEMRQRHEHETSDDYLEELVEAAAEAGSAGSLEKVWRCCWLRTQGVFYRSWTPREKGQARELLEQVEDVALAVDLVRAAAESWSDCTTTVKREAALREAPARPAIGWLLRYRTDVWAWYEAAAAEPESRGTSVAEAIESGEL